ncbi:MAG: zinc-dependent alcohol dehydrogenase [Gammaproteobacteria bacterium]
MKAAAVFHIETEKTEIREVRLEKLKEDEVLVRSICSAISPGTESMIYRGEIPSGIAADSSISCLAANFEYPFRYGYSLVGHITAIGEQVARDWMNRRVFLFHPHQDRVVAPIRDCLPIPDDVSEEEALFLPNMESALNFVMDANPVFGSRVMVFGLGVVGLLTCLLLQRSPLDRLIAADPLSYRRKRARELGLSAVIDPLDETRWQALLGELFDTKGPDGVDVAIEVSGNMQALNQAIEATGFSGRILSASWYGTQNRPLNLGGHFHRRRIEIVSSQVSTIDPRLCGRWTKTRRIELAWNMIRELRPSSLISHRFPLAECNRAFQVASRRLDGAFQVVFDYS